jgi:DNA-directed RNA polymerase subunit RPC12/RpoP
VSRPVYECPVCGTRQPVRTVDPEDPPQTLGNTQCQGAYGGCLRQTRLEYVPDARFDPGEWELQCPRCGYETVDWGEMGFGPTDSWACPDCESRMLVRSVENRAEQEGNPG